MSGSVTLRASGQAKPGNAFEDQMASGYDANEFLEYLKAKKSKLSSRQKPIVKNSETMTAINTKIAT